MEAGVELALLSIEIERFSFDFSKTVNKIVICNQLSRIYFVNYYHHIDR